MISDKIEIETQEGDKFIEGIFKGVIYSFDNSIGFDVISWIFSTFQILVGLQHNKAEDEYKNQVVSSCDHDLELLVE